MTFSHQTSNHHQSQTTTTIHSEQEPPNATDLSPSADAVLGDPLT